jgi:hypothetical protein
VLPHTVQHYGFDDPAPTYGNQDFSFMYDFLRLEAGRRDVLWNPETAYWVSFDIDVPLWLPLYAERRLHDLRRLAADEDAGRLGDATHPGARLQGQVTFSSGWEWGNWLSDLVAARAAFDPELTASSDAEALIVNILDAVGLGSSVVDCLKAHDQEPSYPPPGLRP